MGSDANPGQCVEKSRAPLFLPAGDSKVAGEGERDREEEGRVETKEPAARDHVPSRNCR